MANKTAIDYSPLKMDAYVVVSGDPGAVAKDLAKVIKDSYVPERILSKCMSTDASNFTEALRRAIPEVNTFYSVYCAQPPDMEGRELPVLEFAMHNQEDSHFFVAGSSMFPGKAIVIGNYAGNPKLPGIATMELLVGLAGYELEHSVPPQRPIRSN